MVDTPDPFFAWMNEAHPDGTATLGAIIDHFRTIDEEGPFARACQGAFNTWIRRDVGLTNRAIDSLESQELTEEVSDPATGKPRKDGSPAGALLLFAVGYRIETRHGKMQFYFGVDRNTKAIRAEIQCGNGIVKQDDLPAWQNLKSLSEGFERLERSAKQVRFLSKELGTTSDFMLALDDNREEIARISHKNGQSLEDLLIGEWKNVKKSFWHLFEQSKAIEIKEPSVLDTKTASNKHDEAILIKEIAEKFKQMILFGPPGTGKTYFAREAAKLLAGDEKHIQLVVFHPAYEYDQFIGGQVLETHEGQTRFVAKDGLFVAFARAAAQSPNSKFVLLIDEINRGNLPKLLGELLYGLEYRDKPVRLSYREDAEFSVPPNLYILATMNSADKSIGLIDVAVRRRFAFHRMMPNEDLIRSKWEQANQEELGKQLADFAKSINADIRKAGESGSDPFAEMGIGHSYFLRQGGVFDNRNDFADVWRCKLQPLLVEYFEQGWLPVRPLSADEIPDLKSKDSWKHAAAESANGKSDTQAAPPDASVSSP